MGRVLDSSHSMHSPIQHMIWQVFPLISHAHAFVKGQLPTETSSLCRHICFQDARRIIHKKAPLINQIWAQSLLATDTSLPD